MASYNYALERTFAARKSLNAALAIIGGVVRSYLVLLFFAFPIVASAEKVFLFKLRSESSKFMSGYVVLRSSPELAEFDALDSDEERKSRLFGENRIKPNACFVLERKPTEGVPEGEYAGYGYWREDERGRVWIMRGPFSWSPKLLDVYEVNGSLSGELFEPESSGRVRRTVAVSSGPDRPFKDCASKVKGLVIN